MSANTMSQFDQVADACRKIFEAKTMDYGPTWRILRSGSIADQMYIKGKRIRTLEEKEQSRIDEGIDEEYRGLFNYGAIALIQLEMGVADEVDIDNRRALELYREKVQEARNLLEKKNHDYGEAWREMKIESITDLILVKLWRIRNIDQLKQKLKISEGAEGNYLDIMNYAVFALIKLSETAGVDADK